MDDAEFDRQKARIQKLIEAWVRPLGLHWGRVTFQYCRDAGEYERLRPRRAFDTAPREWQQGLAYCDTDWRYAESTITFNMSSAAILGDDELENGFVHELARISLMKMREWMHGNDNGVATDHEERVATTLAKAFIWLRDAITEPHEQPSD